MADLPSSAAPYLPPVPRPPHDPTSLRLDQRTGWQTLRLEQAVISPAGVLLLAPAPETQRSVLESSGVFGGLSLPTGASLEGGDLFLLDRKNLALKRLDPCAGSAACSCRFEALPCFGGQGSGARQLDNPHGLGVRNGRIYVCDTGNHRLGVFTLRGFALLGHWRPPAAANLPQAWEPYDIAFDRRGRIYASDRANSRVHLFNTAGAWLGQWQGIALASHLASDRHGTVYAVSGDPEAAVYRLLPGWQVEAVPPETNRLAESFGTLPFKVDALGRLHLASMCSACPASQGKQPPGGGQPEACVFDLNGEQAILSPGAPLPLYTRSGCYWSGPLDSQLYRCIWHRIIVRGALPAGARLTAATFTSEVLLPDQAVHELPADAWETNQTAAEMQGGAWDCLVRSGGGRYLWLRLELAGNGFATPWLESVEIEFPRIGLSPYLPAVFGEDPASADFTDRFLALFDTTLRSIEHTLDTQARFYDPLSAPGKTSGNSQVDFLTWLAGWIGVALDRHWPEPKQRQFLKQAGRIFNLRGTRRGLWEQLLIFLDMQRYLPPPSKTARESRPAQTCRPQPLNCAPPEPPGCAWPPPPLVLEHYQLRRWLFLGAGRLGEQAEVWGKSIVNRSQLDQNARLDQTQLIQTQDPYRDPFHVYSHKFTVFVPRRYRDSEQQRKGLENLLKSESPAHTQYHLEYVEPRFRVGIQAMIGYDAVIGEYPQGVSLGETPLGQGSVLTSGSGKDGSGEAFEVGNHRRIR